MAFCLTVFFCKALKNVFVFIMASDLQSCQSFGKNTVAFLNVFAALNPPFYCCTVTLPYTHCVFAYSSQLPPSHPAAPPEHLKEPLAYMRKAQVSLSAFISVTAHSFFFYLSVSFFVCRIWRRARFICNRVSEAKFSFVCVLLHRPAGRSASSKA